MVRTKIGQSVKLVLWLTIASLLIAMNYGCRTTSTTPIPVVITEPTDPIELSIQTVQKCILWGESGTINLQDVINKKRCAMDPHAVIGTDAKIDRNATKELQKAGGKMGIAVHPFYAPWDKGAEASLRLLKDNAKYYDYIVIDYEARWIDFEFVEACKKFGKPVVIAPLARADSMIRDYKDFSRMEDIIFCWWNYSYQLKDWEAFFRDYKFRPSTKHVVLLSIGEKYRKYVSDAEVERIIRKLDGIRAGSFSPKNDFDAVRKVGRYLEQPK